MTATGTLKTSNGVGRFQLESAALGRRADTEGAAAGNRELLFADQENPSGIGLDDPFALPARIREIQVERDKR